MAVNAPRLGQMPGIMGNSLDEDDDYDSWTLEEETFYFFLKEFIPWQPAVDVLLPWQKGF